ncbi:hypothetical protein AB0E27_19650 [Streptomyces sparsogenes]|uniref:hypothetical protein n=1 Tax=Streptomyces sparsogenes TaxID=67365 RepID=UPI0033FDB4AB
MSRPQKIALAFGAAGLVGGGLAVGVGVSQASETAKSTTVTVTSPSGSCALLNNAAFEQVREPGKFLIRRAVIERVG